jgi:hypothetical protein
MDECFEKLYQVLNRYRNKVHFEVNL